MKYTILLLLIISNLSLAQTIYERDARFHPVLAPTDRGMVVSQESLASQVGAEILARGGNAVDAAVATGFALAVTFPQAGNLGGGGFMMVYMEEQGQTFAVDYRETAPSSAHRDMYIKENGEVDAESKRFGIASAAVPGTVAGLLLAHERWGALSRQEILDPAITLAQQGFVIGDSLAYSLNRAARRFKTQASREYFLGENQSGRKVGQLWIQQDLAKTLQKIADQGVEGFYSGSTAELIVAQVEELGGQITADDLSSYQAVIRQPVIGTYRDYEIASMPPPSSGGVHLIQMLNILEQASLNEYEHNSSAYLHLLVEAMKPAYADRSKHLGDPDFVDIPVEQILSKVYAKEIWSDISKASVRPSSEILPANFAKSESPDTTHYSVWDKDGNVVSNTYTLNFSYGNGIAVKGAGFLLNNEMDDFSARPGALNAYGLVGSMANSIQPGKRPLSSMTPTIIFKDDEPFMVTGSPGGSRIITTVLQSILNVVDQDMNAAEAVSAPRIHHQWQPDKIFWEQGISADTRAVMQGMGHIFNEQPRTFAKLEVIMATESGLQGAADPRWPGSGVAVEPRASSSDD